MAVMLMLTAPKSLVAVEQVKGLALSLPDSIDDIGQKERGGQTLEIHKDQLIPTLNAYLHKNSEVLDVYWIPLGHSSECPEATTSDEDEKLQNAKAHTVETTREFYQAYNVKVLKHKVVKSTNYTRKQKPYDARNNYVKQGDLVPDAVSLAKDARHIHECAAEDSHTTVLCVALRDQHGHIKKFAFHNSASVMGPKLRNKAQELGYDVIKSDRAHAEGEFLLFLLKRDTKGHYTHIIAMGCSRPHCAECDVLFRLFLGRQYSNITAAATSPSVDYPVVAITNSPTSPLDFTLTRHRNYTIFLGKRAVGNKIYDRFYIPPGLKDILEKVYVGKPIELGIKYGGGLAPKEEERVAMDTSE